MKNKRRIDICLTPSMLNLFDLSNKQVVIIDVFRATSAMCVFLNNGGNKVIPVATVDEAKNYKTNSDDNINKYLVAAERNGAIVPGFDLGNSPLLYDDKNFNGFSLAITTTNGTLAIDKIKASNDKMLLASFLNSGAVVNHLSLAKEDVLIVCSGWKGRFCVEDLLLAGLLSTRLLTIPRFYADSDSVLLANNTYKVAKLDMFNFLAHSAYRTRMNLDDDVKFCLQKDIMDIVPIWFLSDNSVTDSNIGFFSVHSN
tara:strand:- start:97 stop:864 length:768 start_codon:yes stop_codon:yes gene_type:complete